MKRQIPSQAWTILGVGVIVIVGFVLLLTFLDQGAGPPAASLSHPTPEPTADPVVASVNGKPIQQSAWRQAVLLDQVLSMIAGQAAPPPDDTLQRLINQAIILSAAPPTQTPTSEQVNDMIKNFQDAWGIGEEDLDDALKAVGLTRQIFEQSIQRQITVQASMETLEEQGEDVQAWLEEKREQAETVIHQEHLTLPELANPAIEPSSLSPSLETPAAATAIIASPLATPTSEATPLPSTPTPALVAAVPETAPDFNLQRAGGDVFILTEQLAQGPVVLVFFQRCG